MIINVTEFHNWAQQLNFKYKSIKWIMLIFQVLNWDVWLNTDKMCVEINTHTHKYIYNVKTGHDVNKRAEIWPKTSK